MASRILFVDDEENVLSAIRRTFHGEFEIATATNAPEALRRFLDGEKFAVIVSDMDMPGVDGLQLLREVRRYSPRTSRLILTGKLDVGMVTEAQENGDIYKYLLKPSTPEKLKEALREGLALHQQSLAKVRGPAPAPAPSGGPVVVAPRDLQTGDEILEDVVSAQGNILVRRGTKVNSEILNALQRLQGAGRLTAKVLIRRQ